MQRLRWIKQLGLANLVYPGANHTRFEHSLGAYHLAVLLCNHLGLEEEDKMKVCAAALLHDVGHGPLSHATEAALAPYLRKDHECVIDLLKKGEIKGSTWMSTACELWISSHSSMDRPGPDREQRDRCGPDGLPHSRCTLHRSGLWCDRSIATLAEDDASPGTARSRGGRRTSGNIPAHLKACSCSRPSITITSVASQSA